MKPLYIIDFSTFVYRFRSVYTFARVNFNGVDVDTSVLYGFTKALRENPFQDICIVLDGVPSRSKAALPSYKGQRSKDEVPTYLSVPKLEVVQFLTAIGDMIGKHIFVVCSPLQETDEVIGSIVHRIKRKTPPRVGFISKLNTRDIKDDRMLSYLLRGNLHTIQVDLSCYDTAVIASTDGDFIQLQRWPGVSIDSSTSGKQVSSTVTSKSTSGLSPIATIPYKAIYGDVSDNIPPIGLTLNKTKVLEVLNTFIVDDEVLCTFYKAATTGIIGNLQLQLAQLAKCIYTTAVEEFKRNWVVAYLEFRSDPLLITFEGYDIEDTLEKYKIKVRH